MAGVVLATRRTLSLDGEWHFVRDPDRSMVASDLPDGEPISVPGCWEAQVDDPFGVVHAWYWREVTVPSSWPVGGEPVIQFGAVMYLCELWLNGRRVGDHEGGYVPFEIPLRGLQRRGPNRLALLITNPMNAIDHYPALSEEQLARAEARVPELPIREIPHGKQTWYASQSGPWRSVRLEWRPSRRLDRIRATGDWSTGDVTIDVRATAAEGGSVELILIDPSGAEVATDVVAAGPIAKAVLHVARPQAWDVGDPNLYPLIARLRISGEVVDEARTRIGFREIRTQDGRILFNGRPILLRGALDQDLYPDTISTPPSRELLDRQLRLARDMGLNLLRCHIKTPDPGYLDAADEAGMLLWCELPNSLAMTPASASRAETLLSEMVDAVGNHPSVIIWTVINEDWGTDLRSSAADRRWLLGMVERLRHLDPTRLVVDNSPCPAPGGVNFHLDTDLADFHRYAAMPDAAPRWRDQMAELADRPAWLWSPYGDAVRSGDEPVVVSEFGTWGLPDPERVRGRWWAETGEGAARPSGMADRFAEQRLDRIWPDVAALSAGTCRLQVEALRYQVGEMRRHKTIAGLVVTEFTDAYWEANGLLDVERKPKPHHDRLAEVFGPSTLIVDLPRHDLWPGEDIVARITLSSDRDGEGGRLAWRLGDTAGSLDVGGWGASTATVLATLDLTVPSSPDATVDVAFQVELSARDGSRVAMASVPCAILSERARVTRARRISVRDASGLWGLASRLSSDGHTLTEDDGADLLVASRLDAVDLAKVNGGAHLLLLVRSADAIEAGLTLARPAHIQARWPDPGPGVEFTWTGDWISSFSWIRPDIAPELPKRAPLDFTYSEVLPDHVLRNYVPGEHADEVPAGMFVGWVHAPVALVWTFPQGRGQMTLTTLKVAPENGPVAHVLRNALVSLAAP